jgi:hypothetical protein
MGPLPGKLFTWEATFNERHGVTEAWWKPDLRWHTHAATLVLILVASGSLGLGVYKGIDSSPQAVVAIAGVESLVLVCAGLWLTWQLTRTVRRRVDDVPKAAPPTA